MPTQTLMYFSCMASWNKARACALHKHIRNRLPNVTGFSQAPSASHSEGGELRMFHLMLRRTAGPRSKQKRATSPIESVSSIRPPWSHQCNRAPVKVQLDQRPSLIAAAPCRKFSRRQAVSGTISRDIANAMRSTSKWNKGHLT